MFMKPKCVRMRLVANMLKLHQDDHIIRSIRQATTLLLDEIEDRDSEQRRLTYDHDLCDAVAHNISPGKLFQRPAAGLKGVSFDPDQDLLPAAAAVGDQAKVARLLSEKPNSHIKSKFFGYASVNAARRGQKDVLALTLTPDRTGHVAPGLRESVVAAFSEACRTGQQDVFEYLLDSCSRVDWLEADWLQEHGGDAFVVAARHGHTDILKQMLHKIPTIRARNDPLAQSLCKASANGHIDTVRFLLSIGADVKEWHFFGGPLHLASRSGHAHIVRLLLERGAVYYAVSRGDPLYWASMNGYTEVVQILLEHGADINAKGPDYCVLTRAVINGETPMVRFLLQKGVDMKSDIHGDSALDNAAARGHVEIVKLLAELGVDVNGSGNRDPPILRAMMYGQHQMVKTLVELGAKEVDPLESDHSEGFKNGTYPRNDYTT